MADKGQQKTASELLTFQRNLYESMLFKHEPALSLLGNGQLTERASQILKEMNIDKSDIEEKYWIIMELFYVLGLQSSLSEKKKYQR